ncbi:MAG: methyltransferase [Bryobacteraceae bacterium]
MADTHVTPDKIFQLGFGFAPSKAFLSAISLGLFTELNKSPMTAEQIRARLNLHRRGVVDFLDLLVAHGMLEREDGIYSNTPACALFLDRNKPTYMGGVLEMTDARLYHFWGSFTEALQTGKPQNESKNGGPDIFAELYADPARLRGFLSAMTGLSAGPASVIAQKFPFQNYKSFADLGCAQGGAPVQVALAHSHLQGIGFDLPPVQPVFEEFVAAHGLSERLKFKAGSFMTDPLPSVDVYVMGHVLHDWDLETKMMLLRKAYDALPAGGALIVQETLIDDDRRTHGFGLMMSLNMLVETPGGFDFTGADIQGWMKQVGFRETRVEPLAGPDSMAIGIK